MTIRLDVHISSQSDPLTLDDYATYLALAASSDIYGDDPGLPNEVYYSNPKEETELSISEEDE